MEIDGQDTAGQHTGRVLHQQQDLGSPAHQELGQQVANYSQFNDFTKYLLTKNHLYSTVGYLNAKLTNLCNF